MNTPATQSELAPVIARIAALYEKGQIREALDLVKQGLDSDPGSLTLLNILASLSLAVGDQAAAEAAYRRAKAVRPDYAEAHYNLGVLLQQQGRLAEAESAYQQALAAKPDYAESYANLGALLQEQARPDKAEAAYRQAIAFNPDYAEAHFNLGVLLQEQGRLAEAETAYREALSLNPDDAEACFSLGQLLKDQERPEEAEAAYRCALAIKPDSEEMHYKLGMLLHQQQRRQEAEAAYLEALALKPAYLNAQCSLAVLLHEQGRLEEAGMAYRTVLAVNPGYAEIHSNLGNLLKEQARPAEAEAAYRCAVSTKADCVAAHYNLGKLLQEQKRPDEAEAAYRQALAVKPDYTQARWDLALLLLKQGRFDEGWPEFDARFALGDTVPHIAPPPVSFGGAPLPPQWAGEPLSGRSLLVWPEQGFGDEIQFVRYLPLLKNKGLRHLTLACRPPLKALFASQSLTDRVISTGDWRPEMAADFDYWCYSLSVPRHLGTTLENIPATIPYLRADQQLAKSWAVRLPRGARRIGLVWKGRKTHANDANRSLPSLRLLAPLWSIPGLAFVSLQKGEGEDEARNPPAGQPLAHLGDQIADFSDSAAILGQIDLLICVDTAVAHLAAAIGKPCWVLLPYADTDWRWLEDRNDSPWYPGVMRLFRQTPGQDWKHVVSEVAQALKEWLAAPEVNFGCEARV